MPNLDECSKCGKTDSSSFRLDVMNGILFCGDCFNTVNPNEYTNEGVSQIYITLNKNLISAMRYIIASPINKFLSFSLSDKDEEKLSIDCEKYLLNHLEHDFMTLKFYKSLSKFGD